MAETEFNDLMPLTLTYYSTSTITETGQIGYSTSGSTYRARFENRQRVQYDDAGQEVMSIARIIVNSTSKLSPQAKYVLAGTTYKNVIGTAAIYDDTGIHHVAVYLGRERL